MLADVLETATPGQLIALIGLADGVDVLILRATDEVSRRVPARSVRSQIDQGAPVSYGTFLSWLQMVPPEPPRRPTPPRVSEPGNTQHQCRKHERDHDHEKQAEEDLPDRTRQVIRYPIHQRGPSPEESDHQTDNCTDQ